mmetsp:Transcript_32084/g.50077  ORF Transcript_32084/g.50077 Transcript_32084/m.50077 type:complete len:258 (+) Transcript_32084:767-1540(+)
MLLDEPVALGAKSPLSLSSQAPTCNLYFSPMARVLNELKAAGKVTGPLSVEDCLPFDQMHYLGTDAMDEAAEVLEVRRGSKILDVGCGFGGPARYMAHKFDCEVVGMDVQQSLIDGCSQLTNRMIDVKDKIKWIRGSATDPEAYRGLEGHFDGLYSMLTILHIPQSDLVWPLAYNSLKLGGKTYHEDFFMKRDFTDEEKHLLEKIVSCTKAVQDLQTFLRALATLMHDSPRVAPTGWVLFAASHTGRVHCPPGGRWL